MKFFLRFAAFMGLAALTPAQSFWMESITHQGVAPYNPQGSAYTVFRNVKNYGAIGDGVTDDTAAINAAIEAGSRCDMGSQASGACQSATNSPAVVYFPAGTYMVSSAIKQWYMTQLIGNPTAMPVIKATASFASAQSSIVESDGYDNGGSQQDYLSTNIFYRQIRNIIFDTTDVAYGSLIRAVWWPTAQATSLQNLVFKLSQTSGNQHVGVWIENGSGGFMNDLVFSGGHYGLDVGSQQFTARNLTFSNTAIAIYQAWDWGWTYIGLTINNCGIGIDMSAGGSSAQTVGSVTLIDSTISNTPIGIKTGRTSSSSPVTGGSLAIENVLLNNVATAVQGPSAVSLPGTTGSMTIGAWVEGNTYTPSGPTNFQGYTTAFPRPASLLNGNSYYARSKPLYQNLAISSFASIRTGGAKGDGVTDDTVAIQNVITSATAAGQVIYFDCGIYKVTSTINIPAGAKIVGESYPVIMGAGSFFSNINSPQAVVSVGPASGGTGSVEWSDMIVSTQGATAGAILIQWNLAAPATSPSGMWDVHTRIGGFDGSNLQVAQCTKSDAQPNAACYAAFMSMEITSVASGVYMENVWLWTADHDIDDVNSAQLSIYTGRGLSVDSTAGNLWLIGTAVEHHQLFQYQFSNTQNVFMGFIQTETPYYQPAPEATTPYQPIVSRNDPDFSVFCSGKSTNCNMAWSLRILDSKSINVYGTGFYSFFNNYSKTCSNNGGVTCQTQIFGIDEGGSTEVYSGSTIWMYGLNTVGVTSQIDRNGTSIASASANANSYAESIILFTTA